MADSEETLDIELARERLNAALSLQYRSALAYTLASGSLAGFEFQALAERLWEFAQVELEGARLLVEKIVALEGDPTTDVAALSWSGEPSADVDWLIEADSEALEALQAGIEPTGREATSEALEHMLEHLIMEKQRQIDYLLRASRT